MSLWYDATRTKLYSVAMRTQATRGLGHTARALSDPCTTIRYVSTGHRIEPYTLSVLDIPKQARRPIPSYAMPVPGIA
eukprot:3942001-Rhodomonas_salina.2